ncbi:MAG: hypothetical protein ACYCU0_04575 [Solirubrobacteraceae bacterium]
MRVAAPRLAVLAAVREGDHWTTEAVARRARRQLGSVSPSDAAGFVIEEADVTFWGLCPACQRSGAAEGAAGHGAAGHGAAGHGLVAPARRNAPVGPAG